MVQCVQRFGDFSIIHCGDIVSQAQHGDNADDQHDNRDYRRYAKDQLTA
jgi:hypothetical protein